MSFRAIFGGFSWFLIPISLAYGAIMLSLSGDIFHRPAGVVPYHLLQAQAILKGHLYLGDSLSEVRPGLAWHDGYVQQVWGLGIALWLLPFQAIWTLAGGNSFPDRLALGLAFALLAFYVGNTGLRLAKRGHIVLGIGFTWLIVLSPPLWTMARASQLVFEETVLYGLLLSLGILTALVRVALLRLQRDFWLCCVLAALAGLVRPTLVIYGFGGVAVCCLIVYERHRSTKVIFFGMLIALTGIILLAFTNWRRFGSPTEFGHKLTASSDSMVYLTRFSNPFAKAGGFVAAKELAGAMFFSSNVKDANVFSDNQFPGQTPITRWRRLYLTTFDPTWAGFVNLSFFGVVAWTFKRFKKYGAKNIWRLPMDAFIVGAMLWSSISFLTIGIFYLHFPVIASRYLLDFLPAFIGLLMLGWVFVSSRFQWLALAALALWLVYGISTARVTVNDPIMEDYSSVLASTADVSLEHFAGEFTPSRHPSLTGISFNGYGWEPESGFAQDIVILAVDKPEFIELSVSERRAFHGELARPDVYQASMDGISLMCRQTIGDEDRIKVVFEIPESIRHRRRDELLFLCFSKDYDQQDRTSERILHSIRWR